MLISDLTVSFFLKISIQSHTTPVYFLNNLFICDDTVGDRDHQLHPSTY